MNFAKWVFLLAGIYGLLALTPLYFLESRIGLDYPPAINHLEYYYGFTGVGLAWQIAFLLIGSNPTRFRLMMLPAIAEKMSYGVAMLVLYLQQRVASLVMGFAAFDLVLGILFMLAFWRTPKA